MKSWKLQPAEVDASFLAWCFFLLGFITHRKKFLLPFNIFFSNGQTFHSIFAFYRYENESPFSLDKRFILRVQKIKGIFRSEQGTQPQQGRNTTRIISFLSKKYFSRISITHFPL